MEHLFFPFGIGFPAFGVMNALVSIAYPAFVIWMIVDGFLRIDAEYPGTQTNRKVLWIVGMVIFHPVAIAYFVAVFLKVPRTKRSHEVEAAVEVAPPANPGV